MAISLSVNLNVRRSEGLSQIRLNEPALRQVLAALDKLQTMTNEIQLPGVLVAAPAILDGRIRGRIVVKIQ